MSSCLFQVKNNLHGTMCVSLLARNYFYWIIVEGLNWWHEKNDTKYIITLNLLQIKTNQQHIFKYLKSMISYMCNTWCFKIVKDSLGWRLMCDRYVSWKHLDKMFMQVEKQMGQGPGGGRQNGRYREQYTCYDSGTVPRR